ncbi:MAG: hypothetical protein NTX11_01935 [Candidatus Saccharibacteria bacterium]|nr:hypothetical protein [Candidatus Saccharibacteria bacterium]
MKKILFALLVFGFSMMALSAHAFAAGKVSLTPGSLSLTETHSTSVQVRLDNPIIGPGPDPAFFHLNLTSSDPSRVSITPNPIDYTSADWFSIKTFTVTALNDGVHNASNNVTISFLVDSDSVYYKNYSGNFVISITDINPAPVVQTPVTQQAPASAGAPVATLADTGESTDIIQAISMITLVASVLVIILLNSLRQYR